jgi:hypothetical protein
MIHFGSNGGFQAVNLMIQLGIRRILLLGFDMKIASGDSIFGAAHWFGNHPNRTVSPYKKFVEEFNGAAAILCKENAYSGAEHTSVCIVNCTRDSALKCFPVMTLREALPL